MAADLTYPSGVVQIRQDGNMAVPTGKSIDIESGGAFKVAGTDKTSAIAALGTPTVAGVASGYKVARGVHQQVAQSDTVATGLATVVSVVACFRDVPTAKQQYVLASIGDQSAAPVAGSVLIKTYKSTLAVADDFTDNISFDWIAVGT